MFIIKTKKIYKIKNWGNVQKNQINKENGGVFPEIKHNQESYIKINENEKQEEEKEKIQELEEKNKKNHQNQKMKKKKKMKILLVQIPQINPQILLLLPF